MKIVGVSLAILLTGVTLLAAGIPIEVPIDVAVADPSTARTYAVDPDKDFTFRLVNGVPGATYEIVGDGRRATVPALGTAATALGCAPAADQNGSRAAGQDQGD